MSAGLEGALGGLNLGGARAADFNFDEISGVKYTESSFGGVWRVLPLGGQKVASASYDHHTRVHEWQAGEVSSFATSVLGKARREVLSLAKLEGGVFISGSSDGSMTLWDGAGRPVKRITEQKGHVNGIYSIAVLNPDTLVTGSCQKPKKHEGPWEHEIKVWDVSNGRRRFSLQGHQGGVAGIVALSETTVASCSGDTTVRIWDVARRVQQSELRFHEDYIYGIGRFGGNQVITGSKDRTVKVIDTEKGEVVREMVHRDGIAHASTVYDVQTSGENLAATASRDSYVKIWDRRTAGPVRVLDPEDGFVYSAGFTENGKIVAGTGGLQEEGAKKTKDTANVVMWDFKAI